MTQCIDNPAIAPRVGPLVAPRGSNYVADDSDGVLQNRDIICFSHDWTGLPLSKTHFMRLLSKNNRVLWVNSIGYRPPKLARYDAGRAFRKLTAMLSRIHEPEPNIFVLNPFVIPTQGPIARAVNKQILTLQIRSAMRKLGFYRPINWIFNPAAGVVARAFQEDLLIYHCVDEYTAFDGVSAQSLARLEQEVLSKADIVFVSAASLKESKGAVHPHTFLVRHGVDFHHFRKALDPSTTIPEEIRSLPGPILGYFGLIASDWVDVPLLIHVAKSFPQASLVMLGNVTMQLGELARLPNVHLLGRKAYEVLPNYCKGFDVALIPFPINRATIHANPLKAREYIAAGLPVISSRIPEAEALPVCHISDDPASFVGEIKKALTNSGPCASRSETMRGEGWDARLKDIDHHIAALYRARKDLK